MTDEEKNEAALFEHDRRVRERGDAHHPNCAYHEAARKVQSRAASRAYLTGWEATFGRKQDVGST